MQMDFEFINSLGSFSGFCMSIIYCYIVIAVTCDCILFLFERVSFFLLFLWVEKFFTW